MTSNAGRRQDDAAAAEEGSFNDEPASSTCSDANANLADTKAKAVVVVGGAPADREDPRRRRRRRSAALAALVLIAIIAAAATVPATLRNRDRDGGGTDSAEEEPSAETTAAESESADAASSASAATLAPRTEPPTPAPTTGAPTAPPTAVDLRDACTVAATAETDEGRACVVTEEDIFRQNGTGSVVGDGSGSSGGGWAQLGGRVEGESAGDLSGTAMALSCDGTVLAVGSQLNDGGGGAEDEGLIGSNETSPAASPAGGAVGESSSVGHVRIFRLVPGARGDDGSSSSGGGATVPGYGWQQLGRDIDGEAAKDWSGGSVSLSASGTRVAIGARFNDGAGRSSGQVRVFDYRPSEGGGGGGWTQLGDDVDGEAELDNLGRAVSLSADGTRLAVGSSGADSPTDDARADVGKVRVLELVGGGPDGGQTWEPLGQDVYGAGAGDYFGRAVALSPDGSTLAVGGYRNDRRGGGGAEAQEEGAAVDVGHVRIFRYDASADLREQLGQDLIGEKAGDWFGVSVSLSYDGTRVAVGAPGNNDRFLPGYARVYERIRGGDDWTKVGGDLRGGYSAALSFDGARVAVGSFKGYNNGINSGHVKVYEMAADPEEEEGSAWIQMGGDIDGENRNMFGSSIALSANGMRVASGAPAHTGANGEVEVGAVRVFDWCK